jgi:exodeoxyribonuclease VII large subunit
VVLDDIDPSFTLGKMALSREAILAELRERGLDRRNLALPLPVPPLRVAVLTSLDSDGWNDFDQQLRGSGFGFAITCHAVRVQGPELRPTVLAGLRWFAERSADHDVLCILRGGGSRSDLAWFDDREVALAVARHPLPVLCGIGHQRDQSVLDVIARSQKTPTAVGAWLVDQVRAAAAALDEQRRRAAALTVELMAAQRARITRAATTLGRALRARVGAERQSLADGARRLRHSTGAALTQQRLRRGRDAADLRRAAVVTVEREGARIERFAARQRLLDPVRVLERGYALVRDAAGAVVAQSAKLRPGMALDIAFADGHAHATTTRVFEKQGET